MLSAYNIAALAAILSTVSAISDIGVPGPWAPNDPLVNIYNTGKANVCYKVEFSAGEFPTTTTCESSPGFMVKGGESVALHTGAGFNGGLTAMTDGVKGARHEINFSTAGSTWYDVDYQLGMSDSTLGPTDHRPRRVGGRTLPSVSGEQDTLAKANVAWPSAADKAGLLQHADYIRQGPDGRLTHVYMDGGAPEDVAEFFQLTAGFEAYVGAGSVKGVAVAAGTVQGEMNKAADLKSWVVDTQQMEIVAY